jgi:glycerol transport system ATP-binding protein
MAIELQQVTKKVAGEIHIHATDLQLYPEGFNVLLGETGAGKTTLIKLMAGLEKPTSGHVLFGGADVTKLSPQKRNISLVHQFFINYPNMTVYENIASPLRVAKYDRKEIDRRVREAAEVMKLGPMLERRPQQLSGGQQQRTALARAIVKESDLVLLDEPLANLDYKLREDLREELPRIFADRGATVVYATSEPTEALLLQGHTATVRQGRVTEFGRTEELYRRPQFFETADVFSDPPINSGEIRKEGNRLQLNTISWEAPAFLQGEPDGPYRVGIRPHFVSPRREVDRPVELVGKVLVTELSGSESVAHFTTPSGNTWVSQSHGVHPFQIGEDHTFYINPAGFLYFRTDGTRVSAEAEMATL